MTAPDIAERFAPGRWEFTPEVTEVFDDHVRASVPHYDTIQQLIAAACDWHAPAGSLIADLGCSTGTTARVIEIRHPDRGLRYALYDEQQHMLDTAAKNLADLGDRVTYHRTRIEAGPLHHTGASVTIFAFTLQFLPIQERIAALRLAHTSSSPTGMLLVAEKIRPVDSRWYEIGCDLSHDWKAEHGISADAIRAKARALRGVLIPQTHNALIAAIGGAGWKAPEVLFRWHCWTLVGAFATSQVSEHHSPAA